MRPPADHHGPPTSPAREDISVVCFDELGAATELDPFLTVAAQQACEFGCMGMQLLIERIRDRVGAGPWKKIMLPAELIIRRSVALPGS